MIDLEIKKMRPINMKEMELNRYMLNDNIRKSIILYNKSIAELRNNNIDLAIIDLKKALSYNKGFLEAMKLLGLCYANKKEYKRAEKTFKKLGDYGIYSDLSKEYIKSLEAERTLAKTMDIIRRAKAGSNKRKLSFLHKNLRGKIIVGLPILMVVIVGLTMSYRPTSKLKIFSKSAESISGTVESNDKTVEDYNQNKILPEKNTVSHMDYKNDENKIDTTKLAVDNNKNKDDMISMLNEAQKCLNDKDYEKAVSTLIAMKNMDLDEETKIKFDKLRADIKTKALWTIYNQGNKLYKQGKYQEALPKIKMVWEVDPNLDIMPWVIYQIGTCYKETNDYDNALVFFQKVKDDYPKSKYASSSKTIINQIENKKTNGIE